MSNAFDNILAVVMISLPLLGGLFTIFMFYKRDVLEREPKNVVLKTFLRGVLIGLLIISISIPVYMGAQRVLEQLNKDWAIVSFMIALVTVIAIVEELLKGLVLWRYCMKRPVKEIDGLFDGFFYGVIIGTGTGVIDAIAYSILATDWFPKLQIVVIKYVRVSGTHALFTGMIGLFLAWKQLEGRKAYPGVLLAIELHVIWSCVTFILFYYFTNSWALYGTNFSIIAIYLTGMFILPTFLIRHDKKFFPNGVSKEQKKVAINTRCKK